MIQKVSVKPDRILQHFGQEVEGDVEGHALDGTIVLLDPRHPHLFGLVLPQQGENDEG